MICSRVCALAVALASLGAVQAGAVEPVETPMLAEAVAAGQLPPVAERMPDDPVVVDLVAEGLEIGQPGGQISWIAGRARDIRIMNVYGYARLVAYDAELNLVPDILEAFEVEEGRIFTFHLRPGHRWSDGAPFTTEDFRYAWFEVEQNPQLKRFGPDSRLMVNGEPPTVEILDAHTIRYSWSQPNPELLPALAGARPLYLYAPAHYLQQFHADHADPDELARLVTQHAARDWVGLHIRKGHLYDADNPDLPVLQPWRNTTTPPSERFVFERNPYYYRMDTTGQQLPYIDRVIVNIADSSLIAAKTGAGESDLQARHLRFDDYTFLKQAEERSGYAVLLWETTLGSDVALYPNLNANDPVWRELNRDVRFRRALSLAIDRDEINQAIYYGLARPSNNTSLPSSPLHDDARARLWADYDPDEANRLLDEIGLTERNSRGLRLLPDGRPLEIIIETAGERSSEIDILQLIDESWRAIGVAAFTNPSQRDVFRNRVFSGDAVMSVWFGLENARFTADTVPDELAPVDQNWLQFPKWGQYVQTNGDAGEAPDMDFAVELMRLYESWRQTVDGEERADLTQQMLDINADQVTSIGMIQGVLQPIVVADHLHNVPAEAIYGWDPGAHLGVYRPDTFWVSED